MILWLLIPVVIGFMWAITGIHLCGPTEEFTEFMRKPVRNVFNEDIEEFEYLGAFMYEISSTDKRFIIYWGPIAGMIIMSVTVFMFAIFDSGLGEYCFIMSMTIALYPAIDPLPNFFIIGPYRKEALGILKLRKRQTKRQNGTMNSLQRTSLSIPRKT
ncbi:unnamed protein product [Caenorhabditis brenneri]